MQNEITSTYIISIKIEITWKHTFTLVTRTRQSISQQNPAAVYAKSFQLLSFKGSLSNYESWILQHRLAGMGFFSPLEQWQFYFPLQGNCAGFDPASCAHNVGGRRRSAH